MRRRIIPVTTVFILSLIVSGCDQADNQQTAKSPENKGLHGFVCGPGGKPVPNTTVLVNMRKATVSGDGTFFVPHDELERHPKPILLVQGEHAGKKLSCARFVDYVTGRENITIRLWHSGSITGRILSPEGTPIDGAKVSALMDVGAFTCHGTFPVGKPTVTDNAGRFTLSDLYPDTRYRLRVACPRRERKLTDWIAVGTRELCDKLEVVLRDAPGFVAGRVVDEKGNPVTKARVILGHPCIPDAVVSVTDMEGKFRIEDLIPGEKVTLCVDGDFQKVKVGTEHLVLVARDRKQ